MNNDEFAQKLSFELDALVNDYMKQNPNDSIVKKQMQAAKRMAIYNQFVNPTIEDARKNGPTRSVELLTRIKKSCDKLLEGIA